MRCAIQFSSKWFSEFLQLVENFSRIGKLSRFWTVLLKNKCCTSPKVPLVHKVKVNEMLSTFSLTFQSNLTCDVDRWNQTGSSAASLKSRLRSRSGCQLLRFRWLAQTLGSLTYYATGCLPCNFYLRAVYQVWILFIFQLYLQFCNEKLLAWVPSFWNEGLSEKCVLSRKVARTLFFWGGGHCSENPTALPQNIFDR